jgi:N-ethylmaleimide reductase
MSKLFTPTQVGPYKLSHRVVMAPLTRMRSDPGDIPSDLMVEYYAQRASKGGLIISEATPVSTRGNGYAGAPGIYSDSQIAGWQRVTNAAHAKGGRIYQQLWHVGRQSHVDLQPNGDAPVASRQRRCAGSPNSMRSKPRSAVNRLRTGSRRATIAPNPSSKRCDFGSKGSFPLYPAEARLPKRSATPSRASRL